MDKKNNIFSSMFKRDKKKEEKDIKSDKHNDEKSITDINVSNINTDERYNNEDMLKFIQNYDKKKDGESSTFDMSFADDKKESEEILNMASFKEDIKEEIDQYALPKKEEVVNKAENEDKAVFEECITDLVETNNSTEDNYSNILQSYDGNSNETDSDEVINIAQSTNFSDMNESLPLDFSAMSDISENFDAIDSTTLEQEIANMQSMLSETDHIEEDEHLEINLSVQENENVDTSPFDSVPVDIVSFASETAPLEINSSSEESVYINSLVEGNDDDYSEVNTDTDDEERIKRIREKKRRRRERKKEKIKKFIEDSKKATSEEKLTQTDENGQVIDNSIIEKEELIQKQDEELAKLVKEKEDLLRKLAEEKQSCEDIIQKNGKILDSNAKEISRLMEKVRENRKLLLDKDSKITKISADMDEKMSEKDKEVENLNKKIAELEKNILHPEKQKVDFASKDVANYKFDPIKYAKNYDVNDAISNYYSNPNLAIESLKDTAIYSRNNRDYMTAFVALKNILTNKEEFVTIMKEIEIAKMKQRLELDRFLKTIELEKNRL